jgi:uncharacterized phiE125 gp8 family phage protein
MGARDPVRLPPVQTVAPSALPLALADVKSHLKVDIPDDDGLIAIYMRGAVERLDGYEGELKIALMQQTWAVSYDGFPWGWALTNHDFILGRRPPLLLPLGRSTSIVSVSYFDPTNTQQTLPPSAYFFQPGDDKLYPSGTTDWPQTAMRPDAVTVTFTGGATTPAGVPGAIIDALLLMIGDLYANRETIGAATGGIVSLPISTTVDMLLARYRYRQDY